MAANKHLIWGSPTQAPSCSMPWGCSCLGKNLPILYTCPSSACARMDSESEAAGTQGRSPQAGWFCWASRKVKRTKSKLRLPTFLHNQSHFLLRKVHLQSLPWAIHSKDSWYGTLVPRENWMPVPGDFTMSTVTGLCAHLLPPPPAHSWISLARDVFLQWSWVSSNWAHSPPKPTP